MIELNGKYYVIDVERFFEFCISNPSLECNKDKTVVETWDRGGDEENTNDIRMISKEVSETKHGDISLNIRYDLMKQFLSILITPSADANGMPEKITCLDDMNFGQMLCFNTFLNEGIIVEVEQE